MADSSPEESMRVFARSTDPQTRLRVLLNLPTARAAHPQHLRELPGHTIASARTHPGEHIRRWAAAAERTSA
ncbi:hypothetical protein ACFVH0_40045 [Streptomyces sp. NPDC127117]|uniref:hypothetical protein n=1 Tax=Streptomyces sp. NPDC127117 TaxID=3345368 RepID=UPI0036284E7D